MPVPLFHMPALARVMFRRGSIVFMVRRHRPCLRLLLVPCDVVPSTSPYIAASNSACTALTVKMHSIESPAEALPSCGMSPSLPGKPIARGPNSNIGFARP